jgi:cellulose synthase/poly-beta-1,6-N-acetylglucosamine synthase-like glycosyltransferase
MLLLRCLQGLAEQDTENLFSFSVVVADNDRELSAQSLVARFSESDRLAIIYCVEPRQNIALARNRALAHSTGDFVAFIDDDESPSKTWLATLYAARQKLGADGILGPVLPAFENTPPSWITKGRFFDRPNPETGYVLTWSQCRTGNALLRRSILDSDENPFREQFATAGEDMDFFRRMIDRGHRFVWCREAPVYELVPALRCSRSFLLKRALLRGSNFPKHPAGRVKNIAKSLAAVPAYTLALPLMAIAGEHVFLKYLIKLLDHVSRLLAFSGIVLAKQREA